MGLDLDRFKCPAGGLDPIRSAAQAQPLVAHTRGAEQGMFTPQQLTDTPLGECDRLRPTNDLTFESHTRIDQFRLKFAEHVRSGDLTGIREPERVGASDVVSDIGLGHPTW